MPFLDSYFKNVQGLQQAETNLIQSGLTVPSRDTAGLKTNTSSGRFKTQDNTLQI